MKPASELTDDELNVAICEWLGWRWELNGHSAYGWSLNGVYQSLPSYISGIEALGRMHEVERKLYEKISDETSTARKLRIGKYREELSSVVRRDFRNGRHWSLLADSATSRQRAEALYTVINS